MLNKTEADLAALRAELAELREHLTTVTDTLQNLARHGADEVAAKARRAAETFQTDFVKHTETITKQIEEKPVMAASISFMIGVVLGMLISGRR